MLGTHVRRGWGQLSQFLSSPIQAPSGTARFQIGDAVNLDLGRLKITSIIVHEVPLHSAGQTTGGPILSEVVSPLTPDVRTFFRDRIVSSLTSASYDVEISADATSPVPGLIVDNLTSNSTDFVAMSQEMANHLYQCQKGSSPAGILTVCQVTLAGQPGLAILKLEKEEGARIFQELLSEGRTFRVEHLRQLMLTDTTKVYKVGLFIRTAGDEAALTGLVCDKQRLYNGGVAHFFLEQFLGCRLKEDPQITTQRFYDTVETFINEDLPDPEVKAQAQIALLAELNGTKGAVAVRLFAQENLPVEYRQPFMDRINAAQLPQTDFDKNLDLIRNRLKRIQMSFRSGVAVLASPDSIGHEVRITDLADGQTKVEVTDQMTNMSGRH
jgi:hypothetical protein